MIRDVSTDAPLLILHLLNNSFDMHQIAASSRVIRDNHDDQYDVNQMKALVVTPAPSKQLEDADPRVPFHSFQCYIYVPDVVTFSFLEAHFSTMIIPSPDQGDYYPGIQKDLKVVEPKESSHEPKDEIPEVELKELPPHLEYAFLEENNKLPVNIFQKILS
ncbi:hypothetical protein Tco_0454583 [Tanacetum coccineum]